MRRVVGQTTHSIDTFPERLAFRRRVLVRLLPPCCHGVTSVPELALDARDHVGTAGQHPQPRELQTSPPIAVLGEGQITFGRNHGVHLEASRSSKVLNRLRLGPFRMEGVFSWPQSGKALVRRAK